MANELETSSGTVELRTNDGVAHVEQESPLTRLHYFDGKFLRADALTLEQEYHRMLVRLSNLAGGWGVVHGFGVGQQGDALAVGAGLAMTAAGSTVLASQDFQVKVADLLRLAKPPAATGNANFDDCMRDAGATGTESVGPKVYAITVAAVDALCGNEAVYGKLCEDACVTDSQRPFLRDGVLLRLRPLSLLLPTSQAVSLGASFLRNRVASAVFAAERAQIPSALSAAGLAGDIWCQPAGIDTRDEIAIGVLVREGNATRYVEAWPVRRERMDTQARGYWQQRMAMRPWNVFLAQILQFQCQLSGAFRPGSDDFNPLEPDCKALRGLLSETLQALETARRKYASSAEKIMESFGEQGKVYLKEAREKTGDPFQHLELISAQLSDAKESYEALPKNRMLLNAGFMELPPAGYLPVQLGKRPINAQLSRMFGEGVELFFCAARADHLPHVVEEAQHMERISLTRGLDDPREREQVEIFVPDGELAESIDAGEGTYWTVALEAAVLSLVGALGKGSKERVKAAAPAAPGAGADAGKPSDPFDGIDGGVKAGALTTDSLSHGVAHTRLLDGGGAAITLVCTSEDPRDLDEILLQRARMDNAKSRLAKVEEKVKSAKRAARPKAGSAPAGQGDEAAAPAKEAARAAEDWAHAAEAAANAGSVYLGPGAGALARGGLLALYIDLESKRDPFDEPEGASVEVQFELRALVSRIDAQSSEVSLIAQGFRGKGALVVEDKTPVDVNTLAISISLEITLKNGDGTSMTLPDGSSLKFRLERRGDRGAGELTSWVRGGANTLFADWGGSPRRALLGLRRAPELYKKAPPRAVEGAEVDDGATVRLANERILVRLGEIAEPAGESALRLNAINALASIANVLDDDAFLTRAKRRLFPERELERAAQVRARRDWVVFRRRRVARCEGECACPTAAKSEAFQVWHALVPDEKAASDLQRYLAGDPQVDPKSFGFKRVQVLHYLDQSSTPEEFARQILNEWGRVTIGSRLLLGRVWEVSPARGQGWQNHARLKRLARMLEDVVETPPPTGALHVLAAPPPALEDARFDGGMLLVTGGSKEVKTNLHRVVIVPDGMLTRLVKAYETNARAANAQLKELVEGEKSLVFTTMLEMSGAELSDEHQRLLTGLLEQLGEHRGQVTESFSLRIKEFPSGVPAEGQFKSISEYLKVGTPHLPVQSVDADELGAAPVLFLAGWRQG